MGTDQNNIVASVPRWRVPTGLFYQWGKPAPRSTSPYQKIINKLTMYDNSVYTPMQKKELVSVLKIIRGRLGV